MSNLKLSISTALAASCIFCFSNSGSAESNYGKVRLHLEPSPRDFVPKVAPASDEAQLALKRFRVPPGFVPDVFAAEPMLANPVAFCLDEQGRVFVAETHRFGTSVLDIRRYMEMLDDDLACRSVEDRLAMTKRVFGDEAKQLAREPEIVRLIEDRDHDGKADISSVYAGGFNSVLDGIASGVLARRGKLWLANIPEITLLEGIDKNGHAKSRETFSYGYGVRFSYTGHDLHGLIFGPDGKLYFSFGDRGANVKTKEGKTLAFPDEGAVFRCNPDGSQLEVVHHGLRNPQELAFDEFGNLFSGDNDFDHGDHERLVYVVEGGDSGWRVGYQHPPLGYDTVPWKADKLWVPHFDGQAAYIVPPITNLDDGPSGFVYYPGTGLPEKYNGHFFLCQFKGNISKSGIRSFAVKPSGASFEMADYDEFLWNVQATDVDFGPDSRLYFSDWGEGWVQNAKGRIFSVVETNTINQPIVAETEKLIAKGFSKSSQRDLLKYLSHPNMRVRLEAQFTLAEHGKKSIPALAKLSADQSAKPVARRHAIWALGQISREHREALDPLLPLLADADAEIRAQSAKVVGDAVHATEAFPQLVKLLEDPSLRVRFFAAESLGKLHRSDAVQPLLLMLRENNDRDLYLRHAGVVALSRCAQPFQLRPLIKDNSPAVRMAALLVMRRLAMPEIAAFLNDSDDLLVVEAARAINDAPINEAMPQLAAFVASDKTFQAKYNEQFEALQLRAVNANFRLGKSDNAKALADFAADERAAVPVAEALSDLSNWGEPGIRDRIVGVYRPFSGQRKNDVAAAALRPVIGKILTGKRKESVKLAALDAATKLRLDNAGEAIRDLVAASENSAELRVAALRALEELKDPHLGDAAKIAQAADDKLLRKEGNRIAIELHPDEAIGQIRATLDKGSPAEKQGAIASLGSIPVPDAESILSNLLDRWSAGKLAPELELELAEAAAKHPALSEKLQKVQSKMTSPLHEFHAARFGGNAESGKKIFFERAEAACVRCHKINGEGGDVGPNLTGIGSRQNRDYLVQSIVQPNAQIAPGFETLVIVMKSGASYTGVFKSENETELVLNSPEDGLVKIAKADIKTRARGSSGMLEGLGQVLSKRDIRDLVEFLATSK